MENGNMRCDANVSIRPSETAPFGIRAEVKNLNSFSNLEKAIEAEILLQTITLDSGKTVDQCTKRFDPNTNKTSVIRSKEDAHDYRYFPEPDMVRLRIESSQVERIRAAMPELPDARRQRFLSKYGITTYDAQVLTIDKLVSDWYDTAAAQCKNSKTLANWVTTELLRDVKDLEGGMAACRIKPEQLARMVNLIEDNTISGKIGKIVFRDMFETGADPESIIKDKGLIQITDTSAIESIVREVVDANPAQFAELKAGKAALKGFFVGQVMKKSAGKANPGMVNGILDNLVANG